MGSLETQTLGCKVNYADVQAVAERLRAREHRQQAALVGTCCVTAEGEKQSRKEVRRAARRVGPGGKVFVTGCAALLRPEVFADLADNVFVVTGEPDKVAAGISALLDEPYGAAETSVELPAVPAAGPKAGHTEAAGSRTRFFLKIQDGCAGGCSYCVIPQVRGRPRSIPMAEVLATAAAMVAAGYPELVVSGINAGAWREGGLKLADLLDGLARTPGLGRVRLSSIEAARVTPRLTEMMKRHSIICPHLHLPLQSGDDGVLASMGRRYDTAGFREAVNRVRLALPGINLTADVIVGFPAEDEAAFDNTLDFVEEAGFTKIHVFSYSPRPGTKAAAMGDTVPAEEKKRRSLVLRRFSDRLEDAHRQRKVGLASEILLESQVASGAHAGYSSDYTRFEVQGGAPGEIVRVRGKAVTPAGVVGEVIDDE